MKIYFSNGIKYTNINSYVVIGWLGDDDTETGYLTDRMIVDIVRMIRFEKGMSTYLL